MIRSFDGQTPKIHPSAFISENAYIVGDVEIGPMCSIWPGTIIRANNHKIVLEGYVDIQDNCMIHSDSNAWFGEYVTLGHHVMCHSKTVETHCLLGNGAVVNGEAVINEKSIVAAGSTVLERVVFPPNSFCVGAPAVARRETEERHHKMIRGTAEGYARNGQKFKAENLDDVPGEFLMPEDWRPERPEGNVLTLPS